MKPETEQQCGEEIRKLIGYLKNNEELTNYGKARKGGLFPLGGGGIKPANKLEIKL